MKLKACLIIYGLILSCLWGHAQSNSVNKELYEDGDYFFAREDYKEALYYFIQLLKYDPSNANINFKTGVCLLNIPGQEKRAIPYLETAVKDITIKYNQKSSNERKAPLHAMYYLGNAYRINNEIDKALDVYNEFISSPNFYGNYNERMVTEEIKSCERAKIIKDNPILVHETNLGDKINTKTSDYHAVVSGNEKVMVFVTTLKFYEGLFFSKKLEDGSWGEPENINAQVVSDGDMFPTGLSYDGTDLLLVRKTENNHDIYQSKYINGLWTKAIPLNDNINTRHDEDYASFSKDGNTIFFTSNRRGGYGGFDIYKTQKINNDWGKEENLGDMVNSPFNEASPFLSSDGTKLFFSSDGHFTMGGYDIFYSEKKEDGWKRPVNIGYPLNTTNDEVFFVPVENGKAGYMSLLRDNNIGEKDIYWIVIGEISPMTKQEINKSLEKIDLEKSIKLKVINQETQDTSVIWFDSNSQRFYFDVPKGVKVISGE